MRIGTVESSVLWPIAFGSSDAPFANNDSVLLRIRFGESSILLTGDIEAAAEKAIVKRHESHDIGREDWPRFHSLRADVVKVAHHGSKTSSSLEFISATQARLAIIPVGQTSMFGHPHPEVVNRWKASGAQVLTTGEQGTITVRTDGRNINVETFVKE